jgi:hypothetical protein
VDSGVQVLEVGLQSRLVVLPRHAIGAGSGFALERQKRLPQQTDRDVVQQCGEPLLLALPCSVPYAFQPR